MVEPERFSAVAERRRALAAKREHTGRNREFMRFVPVQLFNRQNRYSTMSVLFWSHLASRLDSNIWLPKIQRGILAKEGILDNAAIPSSATACDVSIGGIFRLRAFALSPMRSAAGPAILIYNTHLVVG